jgi:hypothetical protein
VTKVASVVAGVLLAVGLSAWIGFTWWSLGITVAMALVIGYALRLGENVLEVPISAMLILSVGTGAAADSRIVETFVGTGAGLVAGFLFTSPRVQPAEEAIADLCAKVAGLLGGMAAGLGAGLVPDAAADWLRQARSLGAEIRQVDEALRQAEDSVRLNPRRMRLPLTAVSLRDSLETLEHETTTIRGLGRSLTDLTRLGSDDDPLQDPEVRARLAGVLGELSAAVGSYGSLATEHDLSRHQVLESELERHLAAAREQQDRLSELLGTDPAARPVGWPLRGELISHLDRLRNELQADKPRSRPQRRTRSWRRPRTAGHRQRRSPSRAWPRR